MKGTRTAARVVRNGRVRLAGRTYEPDKRHLTYDGRLDGLRCRFSTYYGRTNLIALVEVEDYTFSQGPDCVDGSFPWYFWVEV